MSRNIFKYSDDLISESHNSVYLCQYQFKVILHKWTFYETKYFLEIERITDQNRDVNLFVENNLRENILFFFAI